MDPELGHACLKAYSIKVETHDNKIFKASFLIHTGTYIRLFEISAFLFIIRYVFYKASTNES